MHHNLIYLSHYSDNFFFFSHATPNHRRRIYQCKHACNNVANHPGQSEAYIRIQDKVIFKIHTFIFKIPNLVIAVYVYSNK